MLSHMDVLPGSLSVGSLVSLSPHAQIRKQIEKMLNAFFIKCAKIDLRRIILQCE